MAILVLLVLAALWAAVLIPPVVRARNGRASSGSIRGSAYRVDVLAPSARPVPGPARRGLLPSLSRSGRASVGGMSPSQRRRRDILFGLGGAVVVTLVLAVVTGVAAIWVLQFVADGLLVAYVLLLVRMKKRAAGGAARRPGARTIRAVPHRSPLAPAGASRPARPRRPAASHVPAGYGSTAHRPKVPAAGHRSA